MENTKTLSESELFAAAYMATKNGDTSGLENLQLKDDPSPAAAQVTDQAQPVDTSKEEKPVGTTPEGDVSKEGQAPEPKSDDQPAPKAGEETEPDLGWANSLDPEIQAKVKSLAENLARERKQAEEATHKFKSNLGRIKAYQESLDARDRELAKLKTVQPAQPPTTVAPPAPVITDDETLKELEQSDPELAKTLRARDAKLIESLTKHFDTRLEQAVKPVEQKINEDYVAEQNRIIRERVTNLDEVISTEYWKEFKQTATPEVAALIRSPHAKNGLAALALYDSWLRHNYAEELQPKEEQPQPEKPAAPVAAGVIKARLDRVQSTSATAKGAPITVKKTDDNFDPKALYEKAFNDNLRVVKR